jgi:thiosulfate reductase cytochrome b subunit
MKASTERQILRWVHIVLSIPIIGYIYGPVASIPTAVITVRWVLFPIVVLSGFWMWKGYWIKKTVTNLSNKGSSRGK